MPAKIKVRILAARHLPVMDRSSDLTDAFVEVKFGSATFKTEVYRKSLNPEWNSDWFRFEVDDEDLQDEPLQIRVLDHDTYSSHDAIGKVYIDLNPLVAREGSASIGGWFPIYDTMRGIRGECNIIVKIDLFSDSNKFRQSSCGVQFFRTSSIPHGYYVQSIHGFVEELVVNDDPEYQWIDKIRSQRSSNEARQVLFTKLSGELQRKIGLKVLEASGNAIIGYRQCFDLEGESGVVVRAIGTAVSLIRLNAHHNTGMGLSPGKELMNAEDSFNTSDNQSTGRATTPAKDVPKSSQRLSESDNTPPKPNSLGSCNDSGSWNRPHFLRAMIQQRSIEMLEYPFFTMHSFPQGFLTHIGGVVSARSVKLLDRIHNPEEPETRDNWWAEIRTEIMSNARTLGCNAVVGYVENTSICDETIVLSASGTAAVINLQIYNESASPQPGMASSSGPATLKAASTVSQRGETKQLHVDINLANQVRTEEEIKSPALNCSVCHIPSNESSQLYAAEMNICLCCQRGKVPDMLLSTVDMPEDLPIIGKGCLVQSRVCRPKREAKGETNAIVVGESLTFLDYELNKQLVNKLKIRGMNACFGLKTQVVIGERLIIGVATATAVHCAALPPTMCPKLKSVDNPEGVLEMRNKVQEACSRYKQIYGLDILDNRDGETKDSEEDAPDEVHDYGGGAPGMNAETFCLEVDDDDDIANISLLLDEFVHEGFMFCTTDRLPGDMKMDKNLQMFARVYRTKLTSPNNHAISLIFEGILKSLCFKLRSSIPCCLGHLEFDLEVHDEDEIQVCVTGICMRLHDTLATQQAQNSSNDSDKLQLTLKPVSSKERVRCLSGSSLVRQKVEVTPLTFIPFAKIEQFLGHLNFFIIRETTSVRECGGLNGFMHSFICEVMAICRSHVSSLGGNALIAFQLNECVLDDNLHKNQSQSLVNICGDVVTVYYDE